MAKGTLSTLDVLFLIAHLLARNEVGFERSLLFGIAIHCMKEFTCLSYYLDPKMPPYPTMTSSLLVCSFQKTIFERKMFWLRLGSPHKVPNMFHCCILNYHGEEIIPYLTLMLISNSLFSLMRTQNGFSHCSFTLYPLFTTVTLRGRLGSEFVMGPGATWRCPAITIDL